MSTVTAQAHEGQPDARVHLLGGVRAVTGRGEPVAVGPPMCQTLLAALALSAGTAVPVSRLVDLMWGADRPRTAERTLHSYITRLRQALGAGTIATVGAAYRLDLPADAVDALRFQRHADAGDAAAALAEWTGPPLAGLHVAPGLAAVLDGLEERWLATVEQELAGRVETDPVASVGRLTELTAGHPTREGLWALLMTALYRAGRQTDALAAYRTARRHLVEHLGVEPGPRLRELEAMILGQDDRLIARGSPGGPRLPAEDGRPGNLPLRLGRLIGRDQDLETVRLALSAWPVVTLIGPGGIGKTRLAVAAASREDDEDGVWLVDLVEVGSSVDVPRAVAGTLGVKEKAGRELTEAIVSALRPRRALVVLDNCEHVLDGAAALAQALADGCPGTRVLATSRERLGLRDGHEKIVPVGPLEPDGPGVELFRERAASLSPGFGPAATDGVVTAICRRLEGVPLAIELAAARTTTLAPTELLNRLDDQLRLLVAVGGGGRASARRHRAMRATVQWSYDLLAPAERLLLRRLAIFVGTFDLAAAEAVAADPETARTVTADPGTAERLTAGPAPAEELLAGLVARSMVVAEPGVAGRRFRFLEPIRQFAAEKLAEAGETDLMAARHAAWCAERVGVIHRLLTGRGEAAGTTHLDDLWPNLRAAFDWAGGRADRHLAHALVRPLVTEIPRRNRAELGDWVERLLAMTPSHDADLVAFGLTWAGQRHKLAQDPVAFERLVARYGPGGTGAAPGVSADVDAADVDRADRAVVVADGFVDVAVRHALASVHQDFRVLGELAPVVIARLRARGEDDLAEHFELDVGASMIFGGRFEDGDAFVDALAKRYGADGPPTLLNMALVLLGYSALLQRKQERAEALLAAAIAVEVPERTHSPNRCVEARAYFRRGETARAFAILRAHIDELLDTGNMQGICVTAVEFVNMMVQADRVADADRVLRHLDRTAPYWATLVADARHTIATTLRAAPSRAHLPTPDLDDHQALEYMRSVLTELAPAARG
ncbi:BTAD domain-containing putative transcriptional regulator [Pseudofrankia sp. BMG5.37]|nr:BTAD domain-containing putative transcriptional regulator [Pseudofrankia sp. BMG5.37]MDT3442304.1 BTAD domain-containing putative transcriptional regulator [Pseudofrankia sp. BMG5.37]